MKLSFEKVSDSLVVNVEGEFDLHTADYFKEEVGTKINEGHKKIILNLESIEFIDSSGLGAILSKYKDLEKKCGELVVINITPQVKRIFEVSGLLRVLDVYSSKQEAVENI